MKRNHPVLSLLLALLGCVAPSGYAQRTVVTVQAPSAGKEISPDLFGIFFEDINYAADGGLYAELVQNRSFEYTPGDNQAWNALTAWELVQRDHGRAAVTVQRAEPLHPNNPHYAVVKVRESGSVGLANQGFDGIVVRAGDPYDVSFFGRTLSGRPGLVIVQLERPNGQILGQVQFKEPTGEWDRYNGVIKAGASEASARLVLLVRGTGSLALDMISLFPQQTFRNRPNGLRADLAQVIADLKPRFVRFPGGCLAHGDGLDNMYRWKDTIGPVEHRKAQRNIWRYHQTVGLGYFEYFQFCEDIGAKPIPVVPAGVCCQNAGHYIPGALRGQQGMPMEEMAAYIQEVLDLIEWANGPATSTWGAKRAAAGHPEPFGLQYLGVGNEDQITPTFRERFRMIRDAVRAKHPEIVVVGTSGPAPDGADFEAGWAFARAQNLAMVDEHYYRPPFWFWSNLKRYDDYDRRGPKVYVGEFAAHDRGRRNTLRSALAEAAYMTSLERNGDVVWLASYAPLLAKQGRTQWRPDLIYFDNTTIIPTLNYHVQQLFSLNAGDIYLPCTVADRTPASRNKEALGTGVFLGTWNTQAEFDNVRVAAGPATVIEASFENPAKNWRPESGAWEVSDGAYRQQRNSEPAISRLIPSPAPDQTNYTLTLRARKVGGAEGFLIGFGAVDPDNYYWWNLGGWGNTRHAVERSVQGMKSTVSPSMPGRIERNRWYDIKVEADGRRIQCFLNGAKIHDFIDQGPGQPADVAVSSVQESRSRDIIVKIVNGAAAAKPMRLIFPGASRLVPDARLTVLAGDSMAVNSLETGVQLVPETSSVTVGNPFDYEAPAHSLTVIRMQTK